jgi:hypothetical protein
MYKYINLNINIYIYIYTIFIYGHNPFVPKELNVLNDNRLDDKLTREEPDPGLEGPKCYRSFGSGSRTLLRTHTKENQAVRSTKHRAQLSCKENKAVEIRM